MTKSEQDKKVTELVKHISTEQLKAWLAYWEAELANRQGGKNNEN